MSTDRALAAFRIVFVAYIVLVSAEAVFAARVIAPRAHLAAWHVIALGSSEIVSALLMLSRRTERVGMIALLFIFAIATILDTRAGDIPVRYAYYAATALFIVFLSGRQTGEASVN